METRNILVYSKFYSYSIRITIILELAMSVQLITLNYLENSFNPVYFTTNELYNLLTMV